MGRAGGGWSVLVLRGRVCRPTEEAVRVVGEGRVVGAVGAVGEAREVAGAVGEMTATCHPGRGERVETTGWSGWEGREMHAEVEGERLVAGHQVPSA